MKTLMFILLAIVIVSCVAPGEEVVTQNSEIKLVLLFEHDGCKVYRFRDGDARFVYWSDCQGQISYDKHVQHGKSSHTEHEVTINN